MYAVICLALLGAGVALADAGAEKDALATSEGELQITFIGHGSLAFEFAGKVVHVDPYGKLTDYAKQPKADIVLLTHDHGDHLDPAALAAVRTPKTSVVLPHACAKTVSDGLVMTNGAVRTVQGLRIEAVPAYNVEHKRATGQPFHPRGVGNGYILTFGDKRVYVAGDTENTPEMKALTGIDVAFLPMNLPYTMTPEMVADAARAFRPKILYPYHYGDTDPAKLQALLKDVPAVEVRVRRLQ